MLGGMRFYSKTAWVIFVNFLKASSHYINEKNAQRLLLPIYTHRIASASFTK